MKRPLVNPDDCQRCVPCPAMQVCPNTAFIREDDGDMPWVDFYLCRGCMKCKVACPHNAIEEIIQPCNGKGRMGW